MTFDYQDLVGKPYAYAGRGPQSYDCYGLVMEIYRRAGKDIPDYRRPEDRQKLAPLVEGQLSLWTKTDASKGAGVLIRMPRGAVHMGVCIDEFRFIHSCEGVGSVAIEKLSIWKRRIIGFYNYEH